MLVCPLCRIALSPLEPVCPRDGHEAAEADPRPLPVALEERFRVVEVFAVGSGGDLYLADDQQTGRRGILKLLRLGDTVTPGERARLKRELLKQATLTHDSLSVPLATGDADGAPWLFREWHEGVSLRVRLTRGHGLPVPEAVGITVQLAGALNELHRAGLLHRDLKPGHVIVEPQPSGQPRAWLIDAGVASARSQGPDSPPTSLPYLSPEQARGKPASFRSDLYALGCVLYELLAGDPPFAGDPEGLMESHRTQPPPPLEASVPSALNAVLAKLLAKEPKDRPFSAAQVRRSLEAFLPGDRATRRESTQTFERLTARQSKTPGGTGTLPPPESQNGEAVRIPPPAGVPAQELPPRQSRESIEELTAEDLVEAESVPPAERAEGEPRTEPPPPPPGTSKATLTGIPSVRAPELAPEAAEAAEAEPSGDDAVDRDDTFDGDDTVPGSPSEPAGESVARRVSFAPTGTLVGWAVGADADVYEARSTPPEDPEPNGAATEAETEPDEAVESSPPREATAPEEPTGPAPSMRPPPPPPVASLVDRDDTPVDVSPRPVQEDDEEEDDADPLRDSDLQVIEPEPPSLHALGGPSTKPPPVGHEPSVIVEPIAGWTTGDPPPDRGPPPRLDLPSFRPSVPQSDRPTDRPPDPGATRARRPVRVSDLAAVFLTGVLGAVVGGLIVWFAFHRAPSSDPAPHTAAPAATAEEATAEPPTSGAAGAIEPPASTADAEASRSEAAEANGEPEAAPVEEAGDGVPEGAAEAAAVATEAAEPAEPAEAADDDADAADRDDAEPSRPLTAEERARRAAIRRARAEAVREEARTAYRSGDYAGAIEAYSRAARIDPRDARTYAGIGAAQRRLGNHAAAVQAYQRAVQAAPRRAGFHAALGAAHEAAGNPAAAREAYQRALELDPTNVSARQGLGQ